MQIVDIKCARIEQALQQYMLNGAIHDDFKSGQLCVVDVRGCRGHLKCNDEIINHFILVIVNQHKSVLLKKMIADYSKILYSLDSLQKEFSIPIVLDKYRVLINPLRALYFEMLNVMNHYSGTAYENTILKIVQDADFNTKAKNALVNDITELLQFYNTYSVHFEDQMPPIQLMHAQKKIFEMRLYYQAFNDILTWTI